MTDHSNQNNDHGPIDAWHDHSADAKPQTAHAERANPIVLFGIFGVLSVSVFLFILVTIIYYNSSVASMKARKLETTTAYTSDYAPERVRQDKTLEEYGWMDAEEETVRIPVERAMQLVVEEN